MPDGLQKNLQVVAAEWGDWLGRMKVGLSRFHRGTWNPLEQENYLHLIVNLLEETIDALPRTITYSLIVGVIVWCLV